MQPSSKDSLAKTFEGVDIRTTPEGQMVAVDVLVALGLKDPRNSWRHLKKQYPELVEGSSTYSFGKGRPPETLSERGVYRLAMVAGGPKAAQFREWASDLIQRVRQADPTLTADLIDRTENPVDLEHLSIRAKSKGSAILIAGEARDRGMCRKIDFAKLHDGNNVFITGSTAKEIQRSREIEITRDGFTTLELATLDLLQVAQVEHLKNINAHGAGEILGGNEEVRDDLRLFRDKYLGKKRRPADRHGERPVITVDV